MAKMYNQVKEYIRQRIQIPDSDLEKAFYNDIDR